MNECKEMEEVRGGLGEERHRWESKGHYIVKKQREGDRDRKTQVNK